MHRSIKRKVQLFLTVLALSLILSFSRNTKFAKWTFMVYLDADNNLENAGIVDFQEMARVGSTDDVNIVVQMDRHPYSSPPYYNDAFGNWDGTRRFLIRKGDDPSEDPVQNLGEQNMGKPDVLQNFVEWAITTYPAEHYALVIWNHGDGWRDEVEEKTNITQQLNSTIVKAIAGDDTDGDILYMREVQTAIENAEKNLQERLNKNIKIDIIGFDACLMGMVEVAYAMRNAANYMVGSENVEPGDGWPYHTILQALTANPSLSPDSLSKIIVSRYGSSYKITQGITQSAVDISKLNNLVAKIDAFTEEANKEWGNLKAARNSSRTYHPPFSKSCWGADLWDFADKVYSTVVNPDIKNAASDLKGAIDDFIIGEYHSMNMEGSHGVAIYFPPNLTKFNNDPEHTGYMQDNNFMLVDFVKDHKWDTWLEYFYRNVP
jgi:hypothetical protein